MAGRIYLSPVTYTETIDPETGETMKENVVLICTLAGVTRCRSAVGTEPTGENRGRTSLGWSLVYVDVASGDWSAIEANNQVRLVRFEEAVDDVMPNIVRNRITQAGALTGAEMPAGMTFRQALQAMLNKHYPEATLHAQFPEIFPEGE